MIRQCLTEKHNYVSIVYQIFTSTFCSCGLRWMNLFKIWIVYSINWLKWGSFLLFLLWFVFFFCNNTQDTFSGSFISFWSILSIVYKIKHAYSTTMFLNYAHGWKGIFSKFSLLLSFCNPKNYCEVLTDSCDCHFWSAVYINLITIQPWLLEYISRASLRLFHWWFLKINCLSSKQYKLEMVGKYSHGTFYYVATN